MERFENEINFLPYISGKLLGDGCITVQSKRKPRFQFIHTASDYKWCYHCYQQLSTYIPLNPPTYSKIMDCRISRKFTERYIVQSKTSEIITILESIWYINRKKIIPIDFLDKYLDERTLAWWYLDDGHLKIDNGIPRKIILSTDSFSHHENHQLIELLSRKFSLYFSLDGQNRLVLYDQIQIYYFYRLIELYLHPSMERKMIKLKIVAGHTTPKPKRTTIYLPGKITLLKPTYEINHKLKSLPNLLKIVKDHENYLYHFQKYFIHIKNIKNTKPYQIIIDQKYWHYINSIKLLTGLNNSQIVSICFLLEKE